MGDRMIWESHYWKEPLLKMADRIERYSKKTALTEKQGAQYERDIFIGYYTVRKLFEAAGKISDDTRSATMSLCWFPKKAGAPIVDWYNRNEFWDLYNLDERHHERREALFVAHRVVHSFVMIGSASSGDEPSGDFFTSDRDKEKGLYFVASAETVALFRLVGSDYPDFVCWRDEVTGEMKWSAPKAPNGPVHG